MKKGIILTAVGSVIAIIGVLFAAYAILPAEDTTDFTLPPGDYYFVFSFGGLIGGSVDMTYMVADGTVRVYVFDQEHFDEYSMTGTSEFLYTTYGDSGGFSFVLPDMDTYYIVYQHEGYVSGALSQDVVVDTTINGVALTGTVIGAIMVVAGVTMAILGTKMKKREEAQRPPAHIQSDVTFFQGQQQNPPGQV